MMSFLGFRFFFLFSGVDKFWPISYKLIGLIFCRLMSEILFVYCGEWGIKTFYQFLSLFFLNFFWLKRFSLRYLRLAYSLVSFLLILFLPSIVLV